VETPIIFARVEVQMAHYKNSMLTRSSVGGGKNGIWPQKLKINFERKRNMK